MRNKLILFDIDGTLLVPSTAHQQAFRKTFRDLFGIESGFDEKRYAGMVDRQIIREALDGVDRSEVERRLPQIIKAIVKGYTGSDQDEKVLAGVKNLLEDLKGKVALGLITGNIREIAYAKMKNVGLEGYFPAGGFGDEGDKREDLVPLAIKDAENKYGKKFSQVIVIGDTPRDIKAALHSGALAVAVGSGQASKEVILAEYPDLFFDDFIDHISVSRMLLDLYSEGSAMMLMKDIRQKKVQHCRRVARIAMFLAKYLKDAGVPINVERTFFAGLVHDIGEEGRDDDWNKDTHAELGARMLERYPFISRIVLQHSLRSMHDGFPDSWEARVLNYSDRRDKYGLVTLDFRKEGYLNKFKGNEDFIKRAFDNTKKMEQEIFSHLSYRPQDLKTRLEEQKEDGR